MKNIIVVILFFIIACMQGYEFGSGDLALYLPYVMHVHDTALFNNDLLIQSVSVYGAPFWYGVAWLLNFSDVKTVFFMLFLLQIGVIISGARYFYCQLFGRNNGWIIFLLLLTLTRSSGAMNSFGLNPFNYFQPCGLALGMLLFLYGFLDAGKYKTAGFITGTMFLYHPISALWACLLFALRAMIGKEPLFSRDTVAGLILLIGCASPYIAAYFFKNVIHPHEPIPIGWWMELAKMRLNHAFFLSRWVPDRFIQLGLVFFGISLFRRHPAFLRTLPIVIAAIIAMTAAAIGEMLSIKMIIQLNLLRCTYMAYILFFACIAFRVSIADKAEGTVKNALWIVLCLLLIIMPGIEHEHSWIMVFLVAFSLIVSTVPFFYKIKKYPKIVIIGGFAMVILISSLTLYNRYKTTGTLFNTSGTGAWYDMQIWVHNHLPDSSCVMTPMYLEGFRSYSMHSIYGDWKDGGSHQFCNQTVLEWWKRMQGLGINLDLKPDRFPRAYHENALIAAQKNNINYVVFDKNYSLCIGPVIYQNERFGIIQQTDSVSIRLR